MIFHEFPDIGWLKRQISQGFRDQLGWGGGRLETPGFPSVIVQARTTGCFRPDIEGPFSIFLNLKGSSCCTVDGHTFRVQEGSYFISNRSQVYSLQVEEGEETETCNIHFGDRFAESVLHSLVTPADQVLELGEEGGRTDFAFFNQLYRRDRGFDELLEKILSAYRDHGFNRPLFEEQLAALLEYQLQQHRDIVRRVHNLPPVKKTTRIEIYKRLARSVEYIHDCPPGQWSLETLSRQACLSKFHFLRLFRAAYGESPHQYIQRLRLEKARELLSRSDLSVSDVSDSLGFANSPSFSRLFFQQTGIYPSRYRELTK